MPFFSVVIPLYNKENFIESTVKSILNQTFNDYEIVIIDDASTDSSLKIANELASAKVKIINHPINKGLSATRNTGIEIASADYIAFLDADDCWEATYLETIASLINQYPEAKLFATNYLEVYSEFVNIPPKTNLKINDANCIVKNFFKASLNQPIYCPSSLCVNKVVFDKIGCYDKQITFGEDVDFNIRANTTFLLAYNPSPLVKYSMYSQNQITNSSLKNKVIPNFNSFETVAIGNSNLKKYMDFHRYIFAKMYKIENDLVNFTALKLDINANPQISGLNYKQLLLLNAPPTILRLLQRIKRYFVAKGYRFTSY
jgi:glycosyltransferase involved in cell wall biosynthesis